MIQVGELSGGCARLDGRAQVEDKHSFAQRTSAGAQSASAGELVVDDGKRALAVRFQCTAQRYAHDIVFHAERG